MHPERVSAAVFIGPTAPLAPGHPERVEAMVHFTEPRDSYEGWWKFNANYWRQDHRGFLEFFFSQAFSEPHSTKPIEDTVEWGLDTTAETLVATKRRPMDYDLDLQDPEQYEMHARLAESETPEGLLLTDEIRDTVNRAIENLPEDLRTAIVLREIDGLSYEEIAAVMNCPIGTVRSRIFRARETIADRLRPLLETSKDKRW